MPNTAPAVRHAIADQVWPSDTEWTFQFAADAFDDADGDGLTYSARLSNGDPLPAWLTFDPATRTFSGTPPLNAIGTYTLEVTASDGSDAVADEFDFMVVFDWVEDVNLTEGNDAYVGNAFSETVYGLGGDDTIFGGAGHDRIHGNGGNDRIDGGGGANVLHGGEGHDYLTAIGGGNIAFGDEGNDQLYFVGDRNQLFGSEGHDWLGVSGHNNALVGGDGVNWIGASGRSNTIAAGGGADTAFAYGAGNYLYGQEGNDWVGVSGDGNHLFGGDGNDWLGASGHGNVLDGGAGDDLLVSAAGNLDTRFVFHAGYGHDVIEGFSTAGGHVLDLQGFGLADLAALSPYMSQAGADVVISFDIAHSVTLRNVDLVSLNDGHFDLV